ncbi:MAG: tetratricopeptide repeat protein [Deltaproteobacteria bacterium]|nr:tetratricopeptide repeat protein [Deltaproteobacteria bacterium]MBK8239186.1 tetratricopeptide repeat protein [Deltaproteobacteria bacterium]MBP7288644.1 tetratricopeptide repeat protein [Nannocystaceae bacterium]
MRRTLALSLLLASLPGVVHALPRSDLDKAKAKLGDEREPTGVPGEPGSGRALEQAPKATDPGQLKAPLPRRAADEREAAAMDEMEEFGARYQQAHAAMAHTIGQTLLVTGVAGRRALEGAYDKKIKQKQATARKLRAAAVARYEDFLELHPDDPAWTPEIMFRLAELHFEAGSERLARQEEAFQEELEAYQQRLEQDPNAAPPPSPIPDYGDAVALYRDVVLRFPRFHLADASLYMMGTLLYEEEEFDQSRQSYLALACANLFAPPAADGSNVVDSGSWRAGDYDRCEPWKKDGTYTDESWLRVGEVHYDLDELDAAYEAYAKVTANPDADLYDEALIRLAWTLYLRRDFADAAKKLDEFVRYADAHKNDGEPGGAIALRDDAVKYIAKVYVEEDWDNDGNRDRQVGLARLDRDYKARGNEKHVPEVYAALGDLLALQTEYGKAIEIWEITIKRWPLAAAAPQIQMRILQAHNALQDKAAATAARDKLATNYLRGTKWFYANEGDPEAVEAALKLAEEALVHTAIDHHAYAQTLRAAGDPRAEAEYAIAAKAYEAYLERFPDTPSSYEYRYNFAESLFYSGQLLAAAEQYTAVRDSNLDNRLQEDAATGAVLAYEAYVEAEKQAGRLSVPDMPKKGAPGPFDKALEIPPTMLALQEAYDRFALARPDSDQTATMKYLAGEVSQRYQHWDEAEERFVRIIDDHCAENVAINAGTAILDAHVVREDLKGAQEWTEKLMQKGCGEGDEAKKFAGDLKTLGNAVRFQEATLLYEAGEFEAAADRYVALVDQAPDDPNADRALNNAAVAYENIGRFGSASQTYQRIYEKYPDSDFADDALLRTGYNHSRFFEFDEAVTSYLKLAEDARYKDSEHRELALENAADLLDNLQDYKKSAAMFGTFAAKTTDKTKAANATFRAAQVTAKTGDQRATIKAYELFLARHGSDPALADKVVESQLRIGQAYAKMGERAKAESYYRGTVSAFDAKKLQAATDAADLPAEAQFLLAEYALADVLAVEINSTGKKMEKEIQLLTERLQVAANAYDNVFPYRRIDWVLAAMYRRGYAFETWAIAIRQAPVPKQLKPNSEAWFAYKDVVDQFASQAETKAIALYEETVKRSKEYSIANEWTSSARERLNIYKPEEYPLLRQPALELQLEDLR